jgi:hypothetical protein
MGRTIKRRYQPPIKIIRLVGKTGFITKKIWEEFFFSQNMSDSWKHRQWRKLTERKYFKHHLSKRCGDTLILNRDNREILQFVQREPSSPPSVAQMAHDEILLRGMLRLESVIQNIQWETEAELKKMRGSAFKIQIQGQPLKYPDILIHRENSEKKGAMAIELERTLKTQKRYVQILGAYAASNNIGAILFIASSLAIKHTIGELIEKSYFPRKRIPIFFCSEEDWLSDPKESVHYLFTE